MAATLGLVFTGRPRLLPLALALLAAALTFGALSARGRVADDGLDRGAARAGRPGGRLRDPVPVARGGGARALGRPRGERPGAGRRAGAGGARGGAGRADDRDGRRGERRGDARAALSPVPMVRGFGVLLVVGVAIALLCALTRRRRCASSLVPRAAPAPARGAALGAGGARRPRGAGARELLAREPAHPAARARRARRVGAPPRAGAVRRASRSPRSAGDSTRRRKVRDRHHQARPAEPRLAAEPQHARADHRRGRGNRPDGRRPRPREAGHDRMDERLPERRPRALRLQLGPRLRQRAPVPGLLAARPVPAGRPRRRRAGSRSARSTALLERDPAVLLPGRDHARQARGDARVRHPPDEPQPAAAADRTDALEPASARRGAARSLVGLPVLAAKSGSQVADPWRRLETLLVGLAAVALVLLLAFRGDRRRALVPLVPIVLATRLVGADPVRGAGAAEPDVGHARRPGDRDLHRVQRAAVRAPPPGAPGRLRHDRGAAAAATGAPAPRWPRRG